MTTSKQTDFIRLKLHKISCLNCNRFLLTVDSRITYFNTICRSCKLNNTFFSYQGTLLGFGGISVLKNRSIKNKQRWKKFVLFEEYEDYIYEANIEDLLAKYKEFESK